MGRLDNVIEIHGSRVRRMIAHADGFINAITGMGGGRDKATYSRFTRGARLSNEELDALYSEEDVAARVCDVVPQEELRQGYSILIASDEDESGQTLEEATQMAAEVKDAADKLDVTAKIVEGRVWGRVFGGGGLILGVDDGATKENGRLREPLREDSIQRFDHINVVDRQYMHPIKYYTDPTSPKLGLPEIYLITPQAQNSLAAVESTLGTLEMHETRLVVFGGTRTSIRTRQQNSGWETSVLQRMNHTLTQFGASWDSLTHILQDANQGVFKMEGFIDALAANETDTVLKRMSMMDMARSNVRALILDKEEEFERQSFNFLGMDKVYELLTLRMAAAARMPVSILMGQAPGGMNATGDIDIRWFYDTIKSSQDTGVRPALDRILRLLMLSKSGPTGGQVPDKFSITFPSLWQPTPSEQADIELKTAQKDEIYINAGVLAAEEVAVARFTPDGFSVETAIDLEERIEFLQGPILEGLQADPMLQLAQEAQAAALAPGGEGEGADSNTGHEEDEDDNDA